MRHAETVVTTFRHIFRKSFVKGGCRLMYLYNQRLKKALCILAHIYLKDLFSMINL